MLKIAFIGSSGGHSGCVLTAIADNKSFIVCGAAGGDANEDISGLLAWIKNIYPDARKYDSYKAMLDIEKPDAAVISPRFDLTAEICIECARRKIHIIAEKPVAIELNELNELKSAVNNAGIKFTAMHFLRYESGIYEAISAARSGRLGDIRLISAQKSYKLGERPDFYKKRETYGGTIPWVGIHGLDWIYAAANKSFLSVDACHTAVCNNNHNELEAAALCQYRLEGDTFAGLSVDYLRPIGAETHGDDRLRIVGSEGIAYACGGVCTLIDGNGTVTLPRIADRDLSLEFFEGILNNTEVGISAEEIFEITRIALLSRKSADLRERVLL